MVDFVEEVEEQLRAERYATLARRWLPWFGAAVFATIVGWLGVWAYNSWQDRNIAAASVAYDKGVTALAAGDQAGAFQAFDPVAKSGPAAYRALSLLQEGNLRVMAGDGSDAAGLYDAAAKAAQTPFIGDLARLKAALALMDTAPFPQLKVRLTALIGDKKPYDLEAREALAMAKLQAGLAQEARGDFNALTLTLGVTPSMRARAAAAMAIIDSGQGKVAGDVVRRAATMPPPSAAMIAPSLMGGVQPADAQDAPANSSDTSGAPQ